MLLVIDAETAASIRSHRTPAVLRVPWIESSEPAQLAEHATVRAALGAAPIAVPLRANGRVTHVLVVAGPRTADPEELTVELDFLVDAIDEVRRRIGC